MYETLLDICKKLINLLIEIQDRIGLVKKTVSRYNIMKALCLANQEGVNLLSEQIALKVVIFNSVSMYLLFSGPPYSGPVKEYFQICPSLSISEK